jgi:hypothetical protein
MCPEVIKFIHMPDRKACQAVIVKTVSYWDTFHKGHHRGISRGSGVHRFKNLDAVKTAMTKILQN